MTPDSWITPLAAKARLEAAGYMVDVREGIVAYRKTGILGKIAIQASGVDELAVFRLEDRGS